MSFEIDGKAYEKPVKLAKEFNIKPQEIFGYIRASGANKLEAKKDDEGKNIVAREDLIELLKKKDQRKLDRKIAKSQPKAEKKSKKKNDDEPAIEYQGEIIEPENQEPEPKVPQGMDSTRF